MPFVHTLDIAYILPAPSSCGFTVSAFHRVDPSFGGRSLHESPQPHLCTIVQPAGALALGHPINHTQFLHPAGMHTLCRPTHGRSPNLRLVCPSCGLIHLAKTSYRRAKSCGCLHFFACLFHAPSPPIYTSVNSFGWGLRP
jgi:hypothetical protein